MVKKKTSKKTSKKKAQKTVKKSVSPTSGIKVVKKKTIAKKVSKRPVTKKKPLDKSKAMVKTISLSVGDLAPDFTLQNQNGKEISLHDFKGKNVVVYFYPKAMTPGCTVQACEIGHSELELKKENIVVLGISADSVQSLKKFEEKEKLNFNLLSDPEKKVIKAYSSWGLKKFMGREFEGILRQSFFINKEGRIAHILTKVDTKTHHKEVLNFFKNLG